MGIFRCLFFLLLSGLIASSQADLAFGAPGHEDIDRLRSNILALDQIQKNIHQDLQRRKVAATLSPLDNHELLVFASYLKDRCREYCTQLAQLGGQAVVADLPCPDKPVKIPAAKARTAEEELAELDRELAESLGGFDEMLLKEQERVAGHQARQRESGGDDGAGAHGGQQGGGGSDTGVRSSLPSKSSGQGTAEATGTTAVGAPGAPEGRAGAASGSGQDALRADDDIVARQLREAAEKETDPELKEKLWQEYRKYKGER